MCLGTSTDSVCINNIFIYLKFGADATLSAKQAMLVTPYDSRKNILTSTATLFKFPIKRTIYVSKRQNVRH